MRMTANRVQLISLVSPVEAMSPCVFGFGHWFLNAYPRSSSRVQSRQNPMWVQGRMRNRRITFFLKLNLDGSRVESYMGSG